MGISPSYYYDLISDPTGAATKARKSLGKCVDCGKAIRSDSPARGNPTRCADCAKAHASATKKWTRKAIIAAIQRWNARYGSPPTAQAWNVAQSSPNDLARFRAGDYPHHSTIVRVFGRWSEAIVAAGFECKHKNAGRPRIPVSPADMQVALGMRVHGASYREIGERFQITPATMRQRFRRYDSKNGGTMATSLSAETVLEREIKRFEDRRNRAETEARAAEEQATRLRAALAALQPQNGKTNLQTVKR